MVDPRRVIGNTVQAKAIHITSEAECGRRFGSQKKTHMCSGVVVSAVDKLNESGRRTCVVTARYDLGGYKHKTAKLNIRSVKAVAPVTPIEPEVPPPPPTNEDTEPEVPPPPPNEASDPAEAPEPAAAPTTTTDDTEDTTETVVPPTPSSPTPPNDNAESTPEVTPTIPDVTRDATLPTIESGEGISDALEGEVVDEPVATAHDYKWYGMDTTQENYSINGTVAKKRWGIRLFTGDTLFEEGDLDGMYSPLDYFLMSIPHGQIETCVLETSGQLQKRGKQKTSENEILKMFGILVLMTRFEFSSRASLWSTTAPSKFVPAVCFGKTTGMPRHRFDDLWSCIRWSSQAETRPDNMSPAEYRWRLIDDMVLQFNSHRAENFVPSDRLCCDESISRWYDLGGTWINIGLPVYIAMDRKPESGCEIQNLACGASGVMLRLLLVKSAEDSETHTMEGDDGLNHGTRILKYLVSPWNRSGRVVCADSYFSSVSTCEEMMRIGLRYIGVVKTATKKFPMRYLSSLEMLEGRGQRKGVVLKDENGDPTMMAYVWVDRERRYFISSTSSLQEGQPYSRVRWRQMEEEAEDSDARRVELTVPQPLCSEIYYSTCAAIDQHNRCRQDDLRLEKKINTHSWDKRVGLSLFGMYVVDAWKMYHGCTSSAHVKSSLGQKDFYLALAEELVDNNVKTRGSRKRTATNEQVAAEMLESPHQAAPHLTPTKRMKFTGGKLTKFRAQGRCGVCYKGRPTTVCSSCEEQQFLLEDHTSAKSFFYCDTRCGRSCFPTHLREMHT